MTPPQELPKPAERQTALVVLGMHRSGMSALARAANLAGFSVARTLTGPKPDNLEGVWEPLDIVRLNQRLLRALDRSWDDPRPIDPTAFLSAKLGDSDGQALALLETNFLRDTAITAKDPRFSRLLPFWHDVFTAGGYVPHYLLVYRNPVSVALSLEAHSGMPIDHAQQLWLAHNLEALAGLERQRCAILSYDDLMRRPGPTLSSALDQLGLLRTIDNEQAEKALAQIDKALQHSAISTEQLLTSPDFSTLTKEVFVTLRLASQRPDLAWRNVPHHMQRWRDAWEVLSPARRPLFFSLRPPASRKAAAGKTEPYVVARGTSKAGSRPVIFHYHLFKNAGSSVDQVLKRNFGTRWVTREFSTGNPTANAREVSEWITDEIDADAFSSHTALFPLPTIVGIEVLPIVFVRHPLDRIRSAYEFERKQAVGTFGARLAKQLDFAGYIRKRLASPVDRQCRNFHVARFCALRPGGKGTELARAKAGLLALPFFGVVEDFAESMARFESWIRIYFADFRAEVVHANVTRKGISLTENLMQIRQELGDELYSDLEKANAEDLELYNTAIEAYGHRPLGQPAAKTVGNDRTEQVPVDSVSASG